MAKRGTGLADGAELKPLSLICWGCSQHLQCALNVSRVACPSCGALNDRELPRRSSPLDVCTEFISQPLVRRVWSWGMVAFVMCTIHCITLAGVLYIYPHFLPNAEEPSFYVHWFLCLWLWTNTTVNYLEAVWRDPGFVKLGVTERERSRSEADELGTPKWEGYTFCRPCQQAKPPKSHHCRICRRCVHGMDHHCPFVGNCVGMANRRAFVLFLFWSASSLFYVLSISVLHLLDRREELEQGFKEATEKLPPWAWHRTAFYLAAVLNHHFTGIHLHAVVMLLPIVTVTFSMTASLLIQQILLISRGLTTITRLQRRRVARISHMSPRLAALAPAPLSPAPLAPPVCFGATSSGSSMRDHWEEVFGVGTAWWTWLLPRTLVPVLMLPGLFSSATSEPQTKTV
ncbi:unnamed protein product [Durusdinium trenchii]|uniref:ZDHHC-type palmitoyltransferase 2 (Zinc finger DHHC domain-containing protein 2) n=2 Tax=Durusdinium trenchii TaxID=1381693 RepID=A0ABP0Q916_9DINO